MIGEKVVNKDTLIKLNSLKPSLSMFILYLGVDGKINEIPTNSNIWFLPNYNIEKMYRSADEGEIKALDWFLVRLSQNLSQNKKSIIMLVNSPFKDSGYWEDNKEQLINIFIEKIEGLIPDLARHIIIKDAATPNTLYKRTLNYKGAAYGWEGVPSQFAILDFAQTTAIKNLYLTGHWTTLAQGISGVAYLGRSTAENILNRRNSTA